MSNELDMPHVKITVNENGLVTNVESRNEPRDDIDFATGVTPGDALYTKEVVSLQEILDAIKEIGFKLDFLAGNGKL